MPGLLDYIPSQSDVQRKISGLLVEPSNRLRGLLSDPVGFLQSALSDVVPTGQQAQEQLARYQMPMLQDFALGPSGYDNKLRDIALNAIVSPAKARTLNVKQNIPNDDLFRAAVSNTPGAQIVDDGLMMRLQRNQLEDQALKPSVRGGVFYLPEGAAQAKYYSTGKNGYGGSSRITGETLIQNPMFAKGGTGGKAPESAFDALMGKGSYQKMRTEALDVNWGRRTGGGTDIEDFLSKYAPELSGQGQYILQNSQKGNQLAYALQEAAVGSAVRNAGHDAVVGYSKGKSGPFLSEVFDVRESHYPDAFGTSRVWDTFLKD